MRRHLLRFAIAGLIVIGGLGVGAETSSAHSRFVRSDPESGATLETAPTTVRVTFSEEPVASLSEIRVLDAHGAAHHLGSPRAVPGDPLTLAVPLGALDRGIYTVVWRVASGVDGHRSSGTFVFGVGETPPPAQVVESGQTQPSVSGIEVAGRWIFIGGLVAMLGAALACVAGFAGSGSIRLPVFGWIAAAVGLVLLAEAQRRAGGGSFGDLWGTPLGRALVWRTIGLAVAGVALLVAWRAPSRGTGSAMWGVIAGAAIAIGGHVGAGHAAGVDQSWFSVVVQWVHFVAGAVWIGGLAALLVGMRGSASGSTKSAVHRYAAIAVLMLPVVVITGVIRAFDEIDSWGDLTSTGYGRAVLIKSGLLVAIAAFAAVNRWFSVPRLDTTLRPLRRFGRAEVAMGALALLAAALLGSLAPPLGAGAPLGLTAQGTDPAASVKVQLSTASAYSGPNRFVVRARDAVTGDPLAADSVSLQFLPLDDPGVASTTLALQPTTAGSYEGSGSNLAFDGRWRITAIVQRGSRSAAVPLEVEARGPPLFLSVTAIPGQPVVYHLEVADGSGVDIHVEPEHSGATQVFAEFLTALGEPLVIDQMVLTTATGSEPAAQQSVRRTAPNRFVADVVLDEGTSTIALVARTADGSRLRAEVEIDLD